MDNDLVLVESSSNSGTSEVSDDEEEEDDRDKKNSSGPTVSYDTSLPTQHTYLGTDLEELSGRTVHDDNSCQTLPLLTLPGVVLVPGQTLPLQIYHPATVSMMMRIIESDRTFGMINSRFSGRTFGNVLDQIGTTAEIRSYREENDNDSFGLSTLRVLAEGRQRFKVLETSRQHDGMLLGKIRILPEIVLGDPGETSRLSCLDRYRIPPHKPSGGGDASDILSLQLQRKHGVYNFAHYTPWPSFVYKQYDPNILMRKIKSQLRRLNQSMKTDQMPSNPREFSYWMAANLPLGDSQRLELLAINDVVQRLRKEHQILELCPRLQCRDCHAHVADQKDIFSMSLQGPQGTYVNPNGYVHESITLYRAKGLVSVGWPSTEQSWFPGYAWTIMECQHCRSHMGWKFTAVKKKLQPTKFWALCRASITINLQNSENDTSPPVEAEEEEEEEEEEE